MECQKLTDDADITPTRRDAPFLVRKMTIDELAAALRQEPEGTMEHGSARVELVCRYFRAESRKDAETLLAISNVLAELHAPARQ